MADNNNILIIAPEIPPRANSWGGSQRMYYLADMLEKQGRNVITISPGFQMAPECVNKEVLYEPVYLGGDAGGGDEEGNGQKCSEGEKEKKRKKWIFLPSKIKRAIYMFMAAADYFLYGEPSSFQGIFYKKWLKNYEEAILGCILHKGIKKVIISGPSFALFSVAEKIKKKDGSIKIIFDYRDPWFLWKKKKNLAYLKEKKYLKNADCIVCFSEAFRKDMCRTFKIESSKTAVVYNGYSDDGWKKAERRAGKKKRDGNQLLVTYVGSMDFNDNKKNYRNPNIVIRAAEKCEKGIVELRFVGVAAVEKMEKRNNVSYIGKVTQEESLLYMLESDVLLNVHDTDDDSGKYLVPGKFYDYMRSGRVLWNIGKEDGLAAEFLNEYGLGVSCANRADSVEGMLRRLIGLKQKEGIEKLRRTGGKEVSRFSREVQNREYIEVLESL